MTEQKKETQESPSRSLRGKLINELSELSLSLSDTLEQVGETELESNSPINTAHAENTSAGEASDKPAAKSKH